MKTVRIIGPDAADLAWVRELTRCISSLRKIVPCGVEFREVVSRLPERSAAFNLRFVATGGTSEQRISLQPCQAIRDFVAAVRAREGVGQFVAN